MQKAARSQPARWLMNAVVVLWVLGGVAIPLRYYVTDHDRADERFSWRMFSAVRVRRCEVDVRVEGAELRVAPLGAIQGGWRTLLKLGRASVISRFLERQCEHPGVEGVVFGRRCEAADGSRLGPEIRRFSCKEAKR